MSEPAFQLLVVADTHYDSAASADSPSARRTAWGRLLFRKVWLRLRHMGVKPDAVALLGDLVNDGHAEGAAADMAALAKDVRETGLPVLALPGNHDGGLDFESYFPGGPGFRELGGYGFLVFKDEVGEGDVTTRRAEDLALPARVAAAHPGLPLVALQHNPLHPRVESEYPYMPANTDAILRSYEEAGVLLSMSGHYHPGQACSRNGKTYYYGVPALAESPFRFSLVTLRGREASIRELALRLETPGLVDVHCHTEFSYCGTTVGADVNTALSQALGVGRLCLTEHAFQLYFGKEEAWSFRWQDDPARVEAAWQGDRGRMAAYRRFAEPRRSGFVSLGVEVDLLADGRLLLAPEDHGAWDVIVGAVHDIPGLRPKEAPLAEVERRFRDEVERLLARPIHVLAHPFRYFRRAGLPEPEHLHAWMADRLAAAGVAAEVNFHMNHNAPAFFRMCVERGVRIALGTDAHDLAEVGELYPHLEVLRQAGIAPDRFPDVLFTPG